MVERRHVRRPRSRVIAPLSPGSLPPRWGEGVAPPSTPHYTQNNTPDTSPHINNDMQTSPDSDQGNTRDTCPSTGAELLHDLHRRLMAQSVNGTLPRRPGNAGHSRHSHRKTRGSRHRTRDTRDYMTLPPPDLLPSSAFNHPSRHTQYSVTSHDSRHSQSHDSVSRHTGYPVVTRDNDRTSDYSPSPTDSTSPPLPSTSLSYPSPPLLRVRSHSQPLTSTMLGSPESTSSGSQLSHLRPGGGQQNSPASPELSSIPRRSMDVTQYQNFEHGIAYVSSTDVTNTQLPVSGSVANLSRFNVSPPSSSVAQPARTGIRLTSRSKLKGKTVSWVADRKLNAKYISEDRKVVKNQV